MISLHQSFGANRKNRVREVVKFAKKGFSLHHMSGNLQIIFFLRSPLTNTLPNTYSDVIPSVLPNTYFDIPSGILCRIVLRHPIWRFVWHSVGAL